MLIQILLALIIGIFAGTITGLTPGIHINLVGAMIIASITPVLFPIDPTYLMVFITSMAITHTFMDFIPSVFLGCPDTDTELSTLPGHQLLKKGKAHEAVTLTLYGSLSAVIILILISFPSIILIKNLYPIIKKFIPFILIFISITLILTEKKFNAFLVFLLTGTLGLITTKLEFNQPLLPLLTGLFGSSIMIQSIKNKIKIPKQKLTKPKFKLKPILTSLFTAPLCSFLPGLGSGQAAVMGSTIIKQNKKEFLILLGATNTFVMGFSFISLFVIQKTRTGAAEVIKELISNFSSNHLILILITMIISGIISFYLTKKISIYFSKQIEKINYTKTSILILIFLIIIITIVSGLLGLIIFIISTFTGLYCINLNVKKINMMGALIIPTISFYLL